MLADLVLVLLLLLNQLLLLCLLDAHATCPRQKFVMCCHCWLLLLLLPLLLPLLLLLQLLLQLLLLLVLLILLSCYCFAVAASTTAAAFVCFALTSASNGFAAC